MRRQEKRKEQAGYIVTSEAWDSPQREGSMDESVDEPKDQFISGLISQLGTRLRQNPSWPRSVRGAVQCRILAERP